MASGIVLHRRPKVPAEDTAAFGAIAERFRRAGALEQAVSLCRDGLKRFPDHISARVTLGWSLLDLGKYDEARIELEHVVRRVPDNLAAIRGLAELHDRFEHTLNLPMDGPGQWPPPPEMVDMAGGDATASSVADLPLNHVDAPQAFEPEAFVAEQPAESSASDVGLPMWTPDSIPVAEPEASVDHHELDEFGVSGDAIAALMAEAESLEAAAVEEPASPEPEAVVVTLDSGGEDEPVGAASAVAFQTLALDDAAEEGSTEQAVEAPAAEIDLVADAEDVDLVGEVSAVDLALAGEAATVELEAAELVEIDTAAVDLDASEPVELEAVASMDIEPAPFSDVAAASGRAETEVTVAADVDAQVVGAEAPADVETTAPAVIAFAVGQSAANRRAATLAALEQMLARVQTRRQQLVSESVA